MPSPNDSDSKLWFQVCNDDIAAFRRVVERHQSAVSAVAYAICGEFAASEDAAQEAFLTAWRERTTLEDPARLRAWLCSIGRNIARNFRRKQHREPSGRRDVEQLAATENSPEQEVVSREEESLVWENLETIPDAYREPLVLFYREGQSVAEVAAALEVSEDVVRQRLSRGRAMLREQVMAIVERTLTRSRPKAAFTTGVLAGVTGLLGDGAVASAATASSAIGAAKTVAAAGSAGILGGLLGGLGGTAGGWLGTWCSAQMAPTSKERDFLLKTGRQVVAVSIAFTVLCVSLARAGFRPSALQVVAAVIAFQAIIGGYCVFIWWRVKEIRRTSSSEEDPNDTPMRQRAFQLATRYRGRRYRSRHQLFGLPLVDVQVSDPIVAIPASPQPAPLKARGWIAIGDDARGLLFASGHRAIGLIAMGDFTLGVVSFGAISAGGLAVGGVSVGLGSFGGLAVGWLAMGGLAMGWGALGGGAVAFEFAFGGFAAAVHLAYGGGAYARDFAVGGEARAAHANDAQARTLILQHPAKQALDFCMQNQAVWVTVLLVVCVAIPLAVNRLRYERIPIKESPQPS